jgi:DNA-directed RNA polymerase subunit L
MLGVPNTFIFTFNKEDHTLGNLLSSRLRRMPYVTFAGYKSPHPLEPKFELRVGTDGSLSPKEALVKACEQVVLDLDIVSREFTKEMELYKIAKGGASGSGF